MIMAADIDAAAAFSVASSTLQADPEFLVATEGRRRASSATKTKLSEARVLDAQLRQESQKRKEKRAN